MRDEERWWWRKRSAGRRRGTRENVWVGRMTTQSKDSAEGYEIITGREEVG